MALKNQIQIYSVDTSAFYDSEARKLHRRISFISSLRVKRKRHLALYEKMKSDGMTKEQFEKKCTIVYRSMNFNSAPDFYDIKKVDRALKRYGVLIRKNKNILKEYLSSSKATPELDKSYLRPQNIISVFESAFTRTLKCKTNSLSLDFIIVETFFYEMFESLVKNGFYLDGDRYIFFTASAGQIRTKKSVFIREDVWEKHKLTIMCGLTTDSINEHGGMNQNKFLAYLALNNSATDTYKEFNIDKSIVVDDFETFVDGYVDYIDINNMSITRKKMRVPIPHTDGCGMVLTSRSKENFMIRLPWIKGLMASFDYAKFIDLHPANPVVKDIYGKEYDVIGDGIEYIFTKSQFKTWDYYGSWGDYKKKFKENNCEACICNKEEKYIPNATLNYQMLQTLSDIKTDELIKIAEPTVDKISNIASNRESMLSVFGAVNDGRWLNNFQKCLLKYPELLNDRYCKSSLKNLKRSLVRDARSGKLDIDGKYTFVIPDLYAFCEWLFIEHDFERRGGLLKDGEVYCGLYEKSEKLDCLRSPHLYREHAVRKNTVNKDTQMWFGEKGIYTSTHDLISKLLQFDVDGDKLLVISDSYFVGIAESHMKDIVPLYYEMKKAPKGKINNDSLYDGMSASYRSGNIGEVSNEISKCWNYHDGDEIKIDLDQIKLLCAKNNFVIDYAKTLYMPDFPKSINSHKSQKVPYFFIYAKGKKEGLVESHNKSVVNQLKEIIPNKHLNFRATDLAKFDYRNLMRNSKTVVNLEIVEYFKSYTTINRFGRNTKRERLDFKLYKEKFISSITNKFGELDYVVDVLVKDLFHDNPTEFKSSLFMFFGDVIYNNICDNIGNDMVPCKICGKRFKRLSGAHIMCSHCSKALLNKREAERMRKKRSK